jgi:FkbM family methyltransferase
MLATVKARLKATLPATVKARLKATSLYESFFARKNAADMARFTDEDAQLRRLYAPFAGPGDLVFDIGANLGLHVKAFRSLNCRVIAVEPQRLCVAALRRAFRNQGITIVPAAVAESSGTARLNVCGDLHKIASLSRSWIEATQQSGRFRDLQWVESERVETTTLDSLIKQYGTPSFIKIDIEGHELAALNGLSAPIAALCFEFTPEAIGTAAGCIRRLQTLGRFEYNFSPGDSAALGKQWISAAEMLALLQNTIDRGDVFARQTR